MARTLPPLTADSAREYFKEILEMSTLKALERIEEDRWDCSTAVYDPIRHFVLDMVQYVVESRTFSPNTRK